MLIQCHQDSQSAAAARIEVDVARCYAGGLVLEFVVTGKIDDMRFPAVTSPTRTDGLWQHTCFEAFVRTASGSAYYEFNLAPSTQWAAYRFIGYRSGRTIADMIHAPQIETRSNGDRYHLHATLGLDHLPDLSTDKPWRLGISAVIEETDGRISHWALAHPSGQADFHHSDCFALELPAASAP